MKLKKIKTIRSRNQLASFLTECIITEKTIDRCIYEPYCHSPEHIVYFHEDKTIIIAETKHRYFEIFKVE